MTPEREEAAAVRRFLEEEARAGRGDLWEASVSAYLAARPRTATPEAGASADADADPPAESPSQAPRRAAPPEVASGGPGISGRPASDVTAEAEALLFDLPAPAPGAMAPVPGDTLERIAEEARACTKCGLSQCRTQAVPGVGSGQSGIVFVGEAPGAEEDRRGEPFVGRAGELLTRILAAMDERRLIPGVPLSRDTVYICNVLKCRPPDNRDPLPHEIESCSPYLYRQLAVLKPRVICCLGKFAAELLLGIRGSVASMRGKVYRFGQAKLLVTYHPAACLRNPGLKRPVWEDMQRLAQEYLNP